MVMHRLWGLAVYEPNGAHGWKPALVYIDRAAANASIVPPRQPAVARLPATWVANAFVACLS
jgi:hypothetical protein